MRRGAGASLLLALGLLVLAGCAAAGNDVAGGTDAPGFWLGLWHGLIAPVTVVVSLFRDDVGLYAVANAGAWYDVGFMIGITAVLSGSARAGNGAGAVTSRRESRRTGRGGRWER